MLLLFLPVLSGCNLGADHGFVRPSGEAGYQLYTNRTLNLSVLVPSGWEKRATVSGMYEFRPPGSESRNGQITVNSGNPDWLTGGEPRPGLSLEEYTRLYLGSLKPEKGLQVSTTETTLSGLPAREVTWSFLSSIDGRRVYRKQVHTLKDGRVYTLTLSGDQPFTPEQVKLFRKVQDSFTILGLP